MKKQLTMLLLLTLVLLPLAGCQSNKPADTPQQTETPTEEPIQQPEATVALADLAETKDIAFSVEGEEEIVPLQRALRDNVYAMYYDAEGFIYVPGEVTDDNFSDSFISVYDDETTIVMTTMKVCYTAAITPEDWIASTAGTEWAPQQDTASMEAPTWQLAEKDILLEQEGHSFQLWTGNDAGTTSLCYTTPFRGGCLALIVSYPQEVAEGWGSRMQTMAQTLVLADE